METLVGSCLGNALTLRGEHQFVPYDTGTPGFPECSLNSLSMQPEAKKKKNEQWGLSTLRGDVTSSPLPVLYFGS